MLAARYPLDRLGRTTYSFPFRTHCVIRIVQRLAGSVGVEALSGSLEC
jgi:hypothetical protein